MDDVVCTAVAVLRGVWTRPEWAARSGEEGGPLCHGERVASVRSLQAASGQVAGCDALGSEASRKGHAARGEAGRCTGVGGKAAADAAALRASRQAKAKNDKRDCSTASHVL